MSRFPLTQCPTVVVALTGAETRTVRIPFDPRRSRRKTNPDGTMSLVDHLYELRTRLLIAVAAVDRHHHLRVLLVQPRPVRHSSLGEMAASNRTVRCRRRPAPTSAPTAAAGCWPPRRSTSSCCGSRSRLTAGVVLACPVWLYQLWAFITPGLYTKERRFAVGFVASAAALFVTGAVLAYLVVVQGVALPADRRQRRAGHRAVRRPSTSVS